MLEAFKNYVDQFDINIKEIENKYNHSLRVKEISEKIAQSLNLNNQQTVLAIQIGILHDIGRFKQWLEYKSFNDHKTIDHGDLGSSILFEENTISLFPIEKDNYEVIKQAVTFHNKFKVDDNISENNLTQVNIIRDADKLDILKAMTIGTIKMNETEDIISTKIKEVFDAHRPIDFTLINNKNDTIICRLALIFDLNYTYSFNYLKENNIVDKLYSQIENKTKFDYYFNQVIEYIEKRTKC